VVSRRPDQRVPKGHYPSIHRDQTSPLRRLKIICRRLKGVGCRENPDQITRVIGRRHQQQALRCFRQPLDLILERSMHPAAGRSRANRRTGYE
jgi:hypothetical protein